MTNQYTSSLRTLILSLIILGCTNACKDEVKPIEFETVLIKDTFDADIEVAYNKAKLNSVVSTTINSNIETAIINTIPIAEESRPETVEDALKVFDQQYKSFKKDFEENAQIWALAIETEILYKTEKLISISLSAYADTGGAHGNDSIQFLNFNLENGSLLEPNDIISDMKGFKALAESFFLEHMKHKDSDISEFFFGKPFQLPENIGFNEEGIILLYNVYEIASYNQGYTEFVIPFESAKEFLKI